MRGQPLYFIGIVVATWIAVRGLLLWPHADAPASRVAQAIATLPRVLTLERDSVATARAVAARRLVEVRSIPRARRGGADVALSAPVGNYPLRVDSTDKTAPPVSDMRPAAPSGFPATPAKRASRWSVSAYAIARRGFGTDLASPLLGGGQAGARVVYAVNRSERIGVFARATTPLKDGPRELAAGVQWQPTRLPVTMFAEVRAARGLGIAPVVAAFGGVNAVPLALGFRLDGYAQGGVIDRHGLQGFADGQVRAARAVATPARLAFDVGAGVWAAVQRGARRVDVGPSVSVLLPAGERLARVTLDWRRRVAGNARPGSGPVLSLGADF